MSCSLVDVLLAARLIKVKLASVYSILCPFSTTYTSVSECPVDDCDEEEENPIDDVPDGEHVDESKV